MSGPRFVDVPDLTDQMDSSRHESHEIFESYINYIGYGKREAILKPLTALKLFSELFGTINPGYPVASQTLIRARRAEF